LDAFDSAVIGFATLLPWAQIPVLPAIVPTALKPANLLKVLLSISHLLNLVVVIPVTQRTAGSLLSACHARGVQYFATVYSFSFVSVYCSVS
jgi:hypothetical protein